MPPNLNLKCFQPLLSPKAELCLPNFPPAVALYSLEALFKWKARYQNAGNLWKSDVGGLQYTFFKEFVTMV